MEDAFRFATLALFCGSGTTLRVAKDLARRAIGVDISCRYCAMSADRWRQELLFAADVHAAAPSYPNRPEI